MESNNQLIYKQNVSMLKRQTDYDEETIIKKLKEYNNDIMKIILEYNNFSEKEKEKKQQQKEISINQGIFKAIRDNFN